MGVIHLVNDREAHDNPGCSLSLQQAFRSGTRLETTCGILETNRETSQDFFGGYEYMGYVIILYDLFTYSYVMNIHM